MPSYGEHMVVGFMFDEKFEYVLLIRKTHPEWQKGLLNGPGGHREERDISTNDTMRREFEEETGIKTEWGAWKTIATLRWEGGRRVWAMTAVAPRSELFKAERDSLDKDEHVEIVPVKSLADEKTVGNVRWLVPMAIDMLTNLKASISVIVDYDG